MWRCLDVDNDQNGHSVVVWKVLTTGASQWAFLPWCLPCRECSAGLGADARKVSIHLYSATWATHSAKAGGTSGCHGPSRHVHIDSTAAD